MADKDENDTRITEAQALMLASMIDKLSRVENSVSTNKNNKDTISWQSYTLGLLGLLWIILSGLFLDARAKLDKIHDEHMINRSIIQDMKEIHDSKDQKAVEISEIKTKTTALERSVDRIILRTMALDRRINALTPGAKPGVGSEGEY